MTEIETICFAVDEFHWRQASIQEPVKTIISVHSDKHFYSLLRNKNGDFKNMEITVGVL